MDAPASTSMQRWFPFGVGGANLSLYVAMFTPVLVTLSLRVRTMETQDPAGALSLVLGVSAVVGLLSSPVLGRLSDRTSGPFGRRRPWIVAGAAVGFLGAGIVATAPSLLVLMAGWCLVSLAYNAVLAALIATVPDQVPTQSRGRVAGIVGLTQTGAPLIGSAIASLFSSSPVLQFMIPSAVALVVLTIFAARLRDRVIARPATPLNLTAIVSSYWVNPLQHRDFAWAWLSLFLVMIGLTVPMTYSVMLLGDRIGVPEEQLADYAFITLACNIGAAVVTSYVGGRLSDWAGRRRVFVAGAAVIIAVALLILSVADTFAVVLVGQALGGVGGGVFFAVHIALTTQLLPDPESAGKDMGVVNIANALPQSAAPAIAPVFLALGGYQALFTFAAVAVSIGGVLALRIKAVR